MLRSIASGLYGAGVAARNALFNRGWLRSYRSSLPVVSVGNATVGGNGKTPVAMAVAMLLSQRGFAPWILSRGYGGSSKGPLFVSPTTSPLVAGDEPVLMARRGYRVVIARSRSEGARWIEAQEVPRSVIVLDDGLQHRWFERDLNLLLVRAGSFEDLAEWQRGELLPFGRFRESPGEALRRSRVVVLSPRALVVDAEVIQQFAALFPDHLVCMARVASVRVEQQGQELTPRPIRLVTGIESPEGVRTTLEELGFTVVDHERYPDHHHFTEAELRKFEHHDCPTVVTEKDWVRLPAELAGKCGVVTIEVVLEPGTPLGALLEEVAGG